MGLHRFVSSASFDRSMTSSRSPAAVDHRTSSTFFCDAPIVRYREKERFSSNQAMKPTAPFVRVSDFAVIKLTSSHLSFASGGGLSNSR